MSFAIAIRNLETVGQTLGLMGLEFDENNTCILGIDDEFSLHMTYEPNSDRLYLYSPLLDGLPKDPFVLLQLYELLLQSSVLGKDLAGGGLGLAKKEEIVLMHACVGMSDPNPNAVKDFLPLYVECVEKMRVAVQKICEKDNTYQHKDLRSKTLDASVQTTILLEQNKAHLETACKEITEQVKRKNLKQALLLVDKCFNKLSKLKQTAKQSSETHNEEQYAELMEHYDNALRMFTNDSNNVETNCFIIARIHRSRALWLDKQGDHRGALGCYEAAFVAAQKNKSAVDSEKLYWVIDLFNAIGCQQRLLGDLSRAIVMFSKAYMRFDSVNHVPGKLIAKFYLNEINESDYAILYEQAEKTLRDQNASKMQQGMAQQIIDIKRMRIPLTPLEHANALLALAEQSYQNRQYQQAIDYLARLPIDGASAGSLLLLAKCYCYIGDYSRAAKIYETEATKFVDINGFVEYTLFLYARGEYDVTVPRLEEIIRLGQQQNPIVAIREQDKLIIADDLHKDLFQNGDLEVDAISFAYYLKLKCYQHLSVITDLEALENIHFVEFEKHTATLRGNLTGRILLSAIIGEISRQQQQRMRQGGGTSSSRTFTGRSIASRSAGRTDGKPTHSSSEPFVASSSPSPTGGTAPSIPASSLPSSVNSHSTVSRSLAASPPAAASGLGRLTDSLPASVSGQYIAVQAQTYGLVCRNVSQAKGDFYINVHNQLMLHKLAAPDTQVNTVCERITEHLLDCLDVYQIYMDLPVDAFIDQINIHAANPKAEVSFLVVQVIARLYSVNIVIINERSNNDQLGIVRLRKPLNTLYLGYHPSQGYYSLEADATVKASKNIDEIISKHEIDEMFDALLENRAHSQSSNVSPLLPPPAAASLSSAAPTLFLQAPKKAMPTALPEQTSMQVAYCQQLISSFKNGAINSTIMDAVQKTQLANQPAEYTNGIRQALVKAAQMTGNNTTDVKLLDDLLRILFKKLFTTTQILADPNCITAAEFLLNIQQILAIGALQPNLQTPISAQPKTPGT